MRLADSRAKRVDAPVEIVVADGRGREAEHVEQLGDRAAVGEVRRRGSLELIARVERGGPIRIDDIAGALNGAYLDWTFAPSVVTDALVALQANWLSDYRNGSGIVLADGPYGATVTIEDSSRVDPWIVRQALRAAGACQEALLAFSRRSGVGFDD